MGEISQSRLCLDSAKSEKTKELQRSASGQTDHDSHVEMVVFYFRHPKNGTKAGSFGV